MGGERASTVRMQRGGKICAICWRLSLFVLSEAFESHPELQVEKCQHPLSECQIAWQHSIAQFGTIADVKGFGRLNNYFGGCRRYDVLTMFATRGLTTVRIDPAYEGK
ncbi:MAG TPA: hypothetical protein VKR52_04765 [Terracidiphilus sp.]|nr:hypothetical protein [Terracidiphilus sp.]